MVTMKDYTTTVGLEIHAELKTRSKMFCPCANNPHHAEPNALVCPICMGHPGTLPTINKEAVKSVLKVGRAVKGKLADFTEFDRKNYFYPDIPKGYQISQYKYPLITGGQLAGVAITRIHLEEDTASSGHDEGDYSLVDFNPAGVPLMELVTEPVILLKRPILSAKKKTLMIIAISLIQICQSFIFLKYLSTMKKSSPRKHQNSLVRREYALLVIME